MTLQMKEGELFDFPNGLYRFREVEEHDGSYLFMRVGANGRMYKSESELIDMIDLGKVIRNPEVHKDGLGQVRGSPQQGLAPDEEASDAGMRARSFQFYTKKWDEDPTVGRGMLGLANFIARWRGKAHEKKLTWDVQPARLLHAIDNCGESGRRPIRAFLSKRGKTKRQKFHKFVEAALTAAVGFYYTARTLDYNDAYAYFRDQVRKERERRKKAAEEDINFPRRMETLRRRITAAVNHTTWALKYSPAEADRKFNGIGESIKAERTLELVIMDHTVLNAWTVIDHVNFVPFKRPTLTVAIDVATRCIVGFKISGEPAGLYSVMETLKHVNKSKGYVARKFPEIDGVWDMWGHPETILVDRGLEFVSPSFQDALSELGTEVMWAPIHNPEYKAIGERFFRTLDLKLNHKLEGAVPYDPKTMRLVGLDPMDKAIMRLQDLDRLIHQLIIESYTNNEKHRGIDAIPGRIWKEKIEHDGRRFMDDVRLLDSVLACVEERTLTKAGIRFKNMVFHDRDGTTKVLNRLIAYETKRTQSDKTYASGRIRVKVKWNPADASKIEIWPIRSKDRFAVVLPNLHRRFSEGISFWHAEKAHEFAEMRDMAFSSDEDKWVARNRLREAWQKAAGILPPPDVTLKDAMRAQSQQEPALHDGQVIDVPPEDAPNMQSDPDDGIVVDSATRDREDLGRKPPGRRAGGKNATKKTMRTKKLKDAARDEERIEKIRHSNKGVGSGVVPKSNGVNGSAAATQRTLDAMKAAWAKGKNQ